MGAVRGAVAAVVLAGVAVVVLAMVVRLATSSSNDITDLEVGECFDFRADDGGEVGVVEVIDCAEPHNAEVVAVDELNPAGDRPYPPDDELFGLADARCADVPPDPRFGIIAVAPTEATWEGRSGRVVCVALVFGEGVVSGRYGAADA